MVIDGISKFILQKYAKNVEILIFPKNKHSISSNHISSRVNKSRRVAINAPVNNASII